MACVIACFLFVSNLASSSAKNGLRKTRNKVIISHYGAVATDDRRCSKIGMDAIHEGGHEVDATVAGALYLGVVRSASSGIGGGVFMLLRLANGVAKAFDMRETAHHLASEKTNSNMTLSCWEVFQKTHKMKGDPSKWVSSKSQMVANEYERRIFERNSQQTERDDVYNDHQSDNFIFLDVVGVDKKGRIYGLGPEAGKYKSSSSRTSDGISAIKI